jgi:hypothetical protein
MATQSPPTDVVSEATALCEELRLSKAALQKCDADLEAHQATLDESRRALAAAEAVAGRKGKELADDAPEVQNYEAKKSKLERLRARQGGLRKGIVELDERLLVTSEKLADHRKKANEKTVKAFVREVFLPSKQQYEQTLAQVVALANALGESLNTDGPDHSLGSCMRPPQPIAWEQHEPAKRLHAEHQPLNALQNELQQYRQDSENRVSEDLYLRRNRRGEFDPTAQWRVTRGFRCNGVDYEVGQKVDAYSIPLRLSRMLHESGCLESVDSSEVWSS